MIIRFSHEQLVFKALCVLDEAVEQAREGPIKGGIGLRFALSFLCTVSEREGRQIFDQFWQIVQDTCSSQTQPNYIRGTYARTYFQGISRSVGFEYTVALSNKLSAARTRKDYIPPKREL